MDSEIRPPTRPKVVFFDAAGTLIHLPQGAGFHYADVLGRFGIRREEAMLEAVFREVWKGIEPPPPNAGPRPDDDRSWWRDLVGRVLDRCGIQPEELDRDAFFDELYAEFVRPAVWRLYPEVEGVLAALAGRFALGVITNFDGRFRTIADQLGIARFFRHMVISSEVGVNKPDPRIFRCALEMAGVSGAEALHAGDDPVADWEGAERAGLRVFRLARPGNSLRDLVSMLDAAISE